MRKTWAVYKLSLVLLSFTVMICSICSCSSDSIGAVESASIDSDPTETTSYMETTAIDESETIEITEPVETTTYDDRLKIHSESGQYALIKSRYYVSVGKTDKENDEIVWRHDFPNYYGFTCKDTSDGVFAILQKSKVGIEKTFLRLVSYDSDGSTISDIILTEDSYSYEHPVNIFECENGDYLLVSKGRKNGEDIDHMTYMITKIDCNANVKHRVKYELGNKDKISFFSNLNGIICVRRTLDSECVFSVSFVDEMCCMSVFYPINSFISKGTIKVNDAIDINGKTIISFSSYDVDWFFGKEMEDDTYYETIREVTDELRENITASLVCFDFVTGQSKQLLSVNGVQGIEIDVSEQDGFAFNVVSPVKITYVPGRSSCLFAGDGIIFKYHFNSEYCLLGEPEETDITWYMYF